MSATLCEEKDVCYEEIISKYNTELQQKRIEQYVNGIIQEIENNKVVKAVVSV